MFVMPPAHLLTCMKYTLLLASTLLYGFAVTGLAYYFFGKTPAFGVMLGGTACLVGALLAMRTVDFVKKYSKNLEEKPRAQITGFAHLTGMLFRAGVPLALAIFALFFWKGGMDRELTSAILISYMVFYPFTLVVEVMLTLPEKR